MPIKITIPKLGLTMAEARILEWRKTEGERVEKGEILLVIETEKVTFEVEAQEGGVLGKILAREGDVLPVGALLGYLTGEGEAVTDMPRQAPAEGQGSEAPAVTPPGAEPSASARVEGDRPLRISPAARKMAREHGVDPSTIKGTGPGGRVVTEDVLRAVEDPRTSVEQVAAEPPAGADETLVPLSQLRTTVSRRMTESFQAPHFYMTVEADAQALADVREEQVALAERQGTARPTMTDVLVKLVAKVLEDRPALNCAYAGGWVRRFHRIHIGVATAVEGGLIVPVIRDANRKTLGEIATLRSDLIQRTRDRKVAADEISGSTFTITNVGMWGVDFSSAIINPPEAAILAVGAIKDQATVRAGKVESRPMMKLTVSIDHRVLDGSDGAAFLHDLKQYIEDPKRAGL